MWQKVLAYLNKKFGGVQESELDYGQLMPLCTAMQHAKDCEQCTDISKCKHSYARIGVAEVYTVNGGRHYITGAVLCDKAGFKRKDEQEEFTLNDSRIPKTRRTCVFENFETGRNAELRIAKQAAMDCAEKMSGLILGGGCGAGKTHLAIAMAIYAIHHGKTALFYSMPELMDSMRVEVAKGNNETLNKAKGVEMLVLDDAGTERATDWTDEQLYKIIDSRYLNNMATVITTNATSLESFKKIFTQRGVGERAERLLSRLISMTEQVWLNNVPDYRTTKQKEKKY